MKIERAIVAERIALVLGFVAMVVAVSAFDWRAGLLVAGVLLSGSALDWRRP